MGHLRAPLLLAMDTREVCLQFGRPEPDLLQGPPSVTQGRACTSIVLLLPLALDCRAVVTKYHRLWLKQQKLVSSKFEVRSLSSECWQGGLRPLLGL